MSFWDSYEFWRDAVLVALISAAALSYLGVWVALKKVVYVPLALSQVSAVGVVLAFLLGDWIGATEQLHSEKGPIDPAWFSLLLAVAVSLYFARPRSDGGKPVVVAYLLSGAAVLLLGGFLRQDVHDVDSILFGSAVLVETVQILYVGAGAMVILALHALLYRRFLFVSFDPTTAGASGIPVYGTEVLLYGSFALMISLATRAFGALPAFGLCVLPALTGLRLGRSMRIAFIISMAVGLASAGLGYYLSFAFELSAGASMVGLAGLLYLVSLAVQRRS